MSKKDEQIRQAVDDGGRKRDQQALMIALTALRDIANGGGSIHVSDTILSSKEAFRAEFGALLQGCARDALTKIEALSGDPFERIG